MQIPPDFNKYEIKKQKRIIRVCVIIIFLLIILLLHKFN